MRDSLFALLMLLLGILYGMKGGQIPGADMLATGLLYALMFQVGMSIGGSENLRSLCRTVSPRLLLLPVATLLATLGASALCALVIVKWDVWQCMALGSGMGYYSLSSILITQLETPRIGAALAAELGTIALLANLIREMGTLLGAPLIARTFGPAAPIAVAGATSADVTLPILLKASGSEWVAIAVVHGILLDTSVVFLVTLLLG